MNLSSCPKCGVSLIEEDAPSHICIRSAKLVGYVFIEGKQFIESVSMDGLTWVKLDALIPVPQFHVPEVNTNNDEPTGYHNPIAPPDILPLPCLEQGRTVAKAGIFASSARLPAVMGDYLSTEEASQLDCLQ